MISLVDWDAILMVAHEACARKAKGYRFDAMTSDDSDEISNAKNKYGAWKRRRDAVKEIRMKAASPEAEIFLKCVFNEE